jgi:hypothetical protein
MSEDKKDKTMKDKDIFDQIEEELSFSVNESLQEIKESITESISVEKEIGKTVINSLQGITKKIVTLSQPVREWDVTVIRNADNLITNIKFKAVV